MARELEIVIPLRDPSEVFQRTIASVIAQTDRNFAVLLSDNYSSRGADFIDEAVRLLEGANIPVRRVTPPEPIGRVEHWNWSHRQAESEWIKPLFVGDWLGDTYVEKTLRLAREEPDTDIVTCSIGILNPDGKRDETRYRGGYQSPEEVLAAAFQAGNCFGGPINICFKRLTFDLIGGYPPALPVSADFWVILMLALRKGLKASSEVLAYFNFHPDRFSMNFPRERIDGPREFVSILTAATSFAAFHGIPHKVTTRNKLLLRVMLAEFKRRLEARRVP